MSARRRSPILHLLSDLAQQQIAAKTQQVEMGGMETDDNTRVLRALQQSTAKKAGDKKRAQIEYARQCRQYRLPQFVEQLKVLKTVQKARLDGKNIPSRWFFDFFFPDWKLIVEIDGGIWMPKGGAHSHPLDIERNLIKRNDAALNGYTLIAFTTTSVLSKSNTYPMDFTQHMLCKLGWTR